MKSTDLELMVGLFLALGLLCLAYLSIGVARKEFLHAGGYPVHAVFSNCSGLRIGSPILIAGVEVGRVKRISLEEYEAHIEMRIDNHVVLQKDAIASIKTKGLIGEKFIELTPGGADEKITAGGRIRDTEPAMDMESLIAKFVHGNVNRAAESAPASK